MSKKERHQEKLEKRAGSWKPNPAFGLFQKGRNRKMRRKNKYIGDN